MEILLYVFLDNENITDQLNIIGASPDDLMMSTHALINKRLFGHTASE
jgi:hypothetical protein